MWGGSTDEGEEEPDTGGTEAREGTRVGGIDAPRPYFGWPKDRDAEDDDVDEERRVWGVVLVA